MKIDLRTTIYCSVIGKIQNDQLEADFPQPMFNIRWGGRFLTFTTSQDQINDIMFDRLVCVSDLFMFLVALYVIFVKGYVFKY